MARIPLRTLGVCIAAPALAIIVVMTTSAGGAGEAPDEAAGASPGPTTLARAVAATRAVASARVELQTTVAGPSGPVTLVHRAEFAGGGARARAESDMSQVAAALAAAGQQLEGDWTQPAGIVVDGDTVYSQLGPMAQALGRAPDDWVSALLSQVVGSGAAADNDTMALVLDPLGPLDLLSRPVAEIEVVGDEVVRGAPTVHLRAGLDLAGGSSGTDSGTDADAGDVGPAGDPGGPGQPGGRGGPTGPGGPGGRGHPGDTGGPGGRVDPGGAQAPGEPPAGSFEARLVAAGFERLPVDVWIDGDGAVRRLAITLDAAGSLTTVFDVYDLGADVDVAAPDPADVIGPDGGG